MAEKISTMNTDDEETASVSQPSSSNDDEFVSYIHNLSPLKNGSFFDCQLQSKEKTIRGVCFSPKKIKRFSQLSESSSPVKIKKFKIDNTYNSEDLVMRDDVTVEVLPELDFPKQDLPTTFNISTVKSIAPGQEITLTAKVVHLYPPKTVGAKNLKLQNGIVADPSGSIKLNLWEDFVNTVKQGDTVKFVNMRVYRDKANNELTISTTKSGTAIEIAEAFTDALPITVVDSSTVEGELIGIDKLTDYLACSRCNKKIDANQPNFIECTNCHFKQKKAFCKKHWFAQIVMQDKATNNIINLTMFDQAIQQAITIVNGTDTNDVYTQLLIESALYNLPSVSITYKKKTG